jgi:exopolysaccharide biosynthesis polyprenyl glycosylphosphotransferase
LETGAEIEGYVTDEVRPGWPADSMDHGTEIALPAEPEAAGIEQNGARSRPWPALLPLRADSRYRRALAFADMAAVALAALAASALGDGHLTPLSLLALPTFVVVAKLMGLYDRDEHVLHKTTLDEIPALFGIATLATLLLTLFADVLVDGSLDRLQILAAWGVLVVSLVSLRALARNLARRSLPAERCLLVGDPATAEYVREKLALSPSVNAELLGCINANGARDGNGHDPNYASAQPGNGNGNGNGTGLPHDIGALLTEHEVDRVILATDTDGRDELLYMIRELKNYGVKVSVLPEASRVAGSSVEVDHLHGMTLLGMRRFSVTNSSRLIKRGFDLVGSVTALLLLSPILLVTAIAIKLDAPGPVFFRQRRVGVHGKVFDIVKFRSMVTTAEQSKAELQALNQGAHGLFKIPDDPRVTRVGKIIRRWQIDELPQLWNVVRGQMSLVGPRPLIPEEDAQIEGWYRRRLDMLPGMTGHWQVLGSSSRISLAEMVKLDYLYVANWSLWSDVLLLLRTVPFLIARRGM